MSETQKSDARNVLVYVDQRPVLDLAGNQLTYSITTPNDAFKLLVTMRMYESFEVKKFYDQVLPKSKHRTDSETQTESQDHADLREFVLNHFVSFSGAVLEDGREPSTEQQREWLNENQTFVERIFNLGINDVSPKIIAESEHNGPAVLVLGPKEHRVPLEYRLYSHTRKVVETIHFDAVLERLTQSDRHQYDKATTVISNKRRRETFFEGNWDVIEQLCNHKLKRLEGDVVIDGQPCNEANREVWLKRLPLIPKIYIMSQVIQSIELKNV